MDPIQECQIQKSPMEVRFSDQRDSLIENDHSETIKTIPQNGIKFSINGSLDGPTDTQKCDYELFPSIEYEDIVSSTIIDIIGIVAITGFLCWSYFRM